jgi:hypothetical protein
MDLNSDNNSASRLRDIERSLNTSSAAAGTDPGLRNVERSLNASSAISYRNEYLRLSKTLTYSYLFVLPLLLLYELGIQFTGGYFGVRIGADVLIKDLLLLVGLSGTLPMTLLVALIGGMIYYYERKHRIAIRPYYFGMMLAESLLYAVVVGSLVAMFVGQLFGAALLPKLQMPGTQSLFQELVLSLGAGVYEELVFRLILVTGLYALFRLLPISTRAQYILAAIIGAFIFSLVHYLGPLGDTFATSSFVFRFLMGLALNALFLLRGFGVAAMTHALYDVIVTLTR